MNQQFLQHGGQSATVQPPQTTPAQLQTAAAGSLAAGNPVVVQFPPHYPWAQQTVRVRVATAPLFYHELWRGIPKPAWYKPLITALLGGFYYLVMTTIAVVVIVSSRVFNLQDSSSAETSLEMLAKLDSQQPLSIAFGLLSISLMLPAGWLALKTMRIKPTGRLWSVALRIRWKLLFATAAIAAAVLLVLQVGVFLVSMLFVDYNFPPRAADFDTTKMLLSILLVLLFVPLQATAEEYVFRGFLLQTFGNWVRNPTLAIIITSVFFGAAHFYDIWGILMVTLMGVAMAYLAVRTGGLEAAIALHVLNNYVAFGFMASGLFGSTAQEQEVSGGLFMLLNQMLVLGCYVLFVELLWQKRAVANGWSRNRVDLIEADVPIASLTPEQCLQAGLLLTAPAATTHTAAAVPPAAAAAHAATPEQQSSAAAE